jgi:hypothetical protein
MIIFLKGMEEERIKILMKLCKRITKILKSTFYSKGIKKRIIFYGLFENISMHILRF